MRIYLDHNATSPLRGTAQEVLARHLREHYGNPSSAHACGAKARAALEAARAQVATFFSVKASEIVFTSGATEANNAAIFGVAQRFASAGVAVRQRAHFVTTRAEHPSILVPLARLEAQGFSVTRIGVDQNGRLDLAELAAALRDETALVSLLWANNETGVVQDLRAIAEIVKARGILLHIDAVQAAGKMRVVLDEIPCDLLSLSGHKLGAPMGIGCLVIRSGVGIEPFLFGGSQERRWRAGTENLLGAIGFGVVCERLQSEQAENQTQWAMLRDRLWEGISEQIPRVERNGTSEHALCNTLSVTFHDVEGAVLVEALDLEDISVSSGSACASGSSEPSHVLLAMGRSLEAARDTIRFSLGPGVDVAQIERVIEVLPKLVERVRSAVSHG